MHRQLPNLLTILNLLSGAAGIINVFTGDYTNTIFFVLAGGLFDFLDGFAARALKVSGPFGKELDSLADMVTFGVLPGLYVYQLSSGLGNIPWVNYTSFLIIAFSAIRLAKFNLDTRQSDKFIGLPTPANAIMVTTIAQLPIHLISSSIFIVAISIISALLLVAPIEMIALKFKSFALRENIYRYLLILVIVVMAIVLKWMALPLIIPVYIFMSFIEFISSRSAKNSVSE